MNDKDGSTIDDVQVIADYYGCEFKIYNNLFRVHDHIFPKK